MTKTVKKRLQAVVALLVTLMIMIGIMPSEALNSILNGITVHAAITIYFSRDLHNGDKSWDGCDTGGVSVSADDGSWQNMNWVGNSTHGDETYTKVYSYTFTSSPTNVKFKCNDHSDTTRNEGFQNGALYYLNEGNSSATSNISVTKKTWIDPNPYTTTDSRNKTGVNTGTGTATTGDLAIDAVLYDYYSDFELRTGGERSQMTSASGTYHEDDYDNTNGYGGWVPRRNVPMLTFNKLMSDYVYNNYSSAGIQPMYFGNLGTSEDIGSVTEGLNGLRAGGNATSGVKQGLYGAKLNSSHKLVMGNSGNGSSVLVPFFNSSFLANPGDNRGKVGDAVPVKFPFMLQSAETDITGDTSKTSQYYLANSYNADGTNASYNYRYVGDNGVAITNVPVYNTTGDGPMTQTGFFPFSDPLTGSTSGGTYLDRMNYGFGMELTIDFHLYANGRTKKNDNTSAPIAFQFRGDDDVVVYVDDYLILDIGGTHGRKEGMIDFANKRVKVEDINGDNWKSFSSLTNGTAIDNLFSTEGDHTLKMFYVERGLFESNMLVKFNMRVKETASSRLDIQKEVDTQTTGTNNMWVTSGGAVASGGSASLSGVQDIYEDNLKAMQFDVHTSFAIETGVGTGSYNSWASLSSNNTYDLIKTSDGSAVPTNPRTAAQGGTGADVYNTFPVKDNQTAKWESTLDVSNLGYRVKAVEDSTKRIDFAGNTANKTVADLFSGSWKYTDRVETEYTGSGFGPVHDSASDYFKWEGTRNYPETIKFTNTVRTSGIQIRKYLSETFTSGAAKSFTIKVTLSNLGGMSLEDAYTGSTKVTDNTIEIVKTLTVSPNQISSSPVTIDGIPVGTSFTVEEIAPFDADYPTPSYQVAIGTGNASDGNTGELTDNATVVVENTKAAAQQYLIVQKIWKNSDTAGVELATGVKFLLQKQNGSSWDDIQEIELKTANTDVTTGTKMVTWTLKTANKITVEKNGVYRILEYAKGNKALILLNEGLYDKEWTAKYAFAEGGGSVVVQNQKTASSDITLKVMNEYSPLEVGGMPKTGARGVYAIVTFGAFAITIAGVALLIYRKKLQTVNIYAVKGSEKPKE